MENLSDHLNNLRKTIVMSFCNVHVKLISFVYSMKPEGLSGEIFDKYSENSEGKIWQDSVITAIQELLYKRFK